MIPTTATQPYPTVCPGSNTKLLATWQRLGLKSAGNLIAPYHRYLRSRSWSRPEDAGSRRRQSQSHGWPRPGNYFDEPGNDPRFESLVRTVEGVIILTLDLLGKEISFANAEFVAI